MKMTNLEDVFTDEMKDIYSAENQIIKALPKMAKASQGQLKSAFEQHLEQTRTHTQRIEQVCQELNITPKGKKCAGMEGLISEGAEVLETEGTEEAKEAALIGAAQRVEHYEIAAYGTARTHARQLGYSNAAELLEQTLREERKADDLLTQIAESRVNPEAQHGDGKRGW
ncbi:MAG TPA: ferritin-like domain-containing protein [Anaerolineales bacterium]|nr:ferritin-like domain-containing protein [Anaerolineales bacterium]